MNYCFSLTARGRFKRGVDTYVWHLSVLLGHFDTRFFSVLKGHVDKSVNSNAFERSCL